MARRTRKKLLADLDPEPNAGAPLDSKLLLDAARPVLAGLETDLLARARDSAAITKALQARHAADKESRRTADGYDQWLRHFVEQVAAAWLLSCVFVRTLEDRELLGQRRIAGPGAADSQRTFLQVAPSLGERDYLLTVFRELSHLPAAKALFDARHNPVWLLAPSSEALKPLLELFRTPSADAPALRFGQESTRFLGDLYQDLNDNVRKRYALLQTPDFVESFILDRTLEPAIDKFGLDDATLIDPTCGSGHFLLGAFERLVDHRLRAEPGLPPEQAARKALDAVFGADINPYAVAVARFRLTLAYLDKAGFTKLADAPELPLHVVVADSLLHNPRLAQAAFGDLEGQSAEAWAGASYALEDEAAARDVLHRRYAAVVGNPPYITPKDRALRTSYAEHYSSCFMNYALTVPFCERFFQLARNGGRVGQITANSFMKREFGKKLIQEYLPTVNLDLIVNTSGAYIPGHGTPTVLLFGTQQTPQDSKLLVVLAKRGEPTTPANAAKGLVWSSIAENWQNVGFDDDYISVAHIERTKLAVHPWSLAGGGASELKQLLEERASGRLRDAIDDVGFSLIIGEDEVYVRSKGVLRNQELPAIDLVIGEDVRDWSLSPALEIIRPFDAETLEVGRDPAVLKELWPWKTTLKRRIVSGSTSMEQAGKAWYDVRRLSRSKHRTPLSITFAFVATHNHFVLDRGGKVFNRSAPIIKLPPDATEEDHLALLAYLNSSTACFWMKQVCHKKSSASQKHHTDPARAAYEFAGTAIEPLPLPARMSTLGPLAAELASTAAERAAVVTRQNCFQRLSDVGWTSDAIKRRVARLWDEYDEATHKLVALQEEIDWRVYGLFGLVEGTVDERVESARLGARPFEVDHGYHAGVSERANTSGDVAKQDLPDEWQERVANLPSDGVRVIENREFKRMWRATERNIDQEVFRAELAESWCRHEVADHLEAQSRSRPTTLSKAELCAALEASVLDACAGYLAVDRNALAHDLLRAGAVPAFAAATFTIAGLEKHAAWQHTWALQRREDAGEDVGEIPVPPKYAQKDYRSPIYWRLRGKLDVPKERFISYPGCESDEDGEPVYGWAGWNHLERAQALVALYQDRKTREAWGKERLTPMLAGLLELLPWLLQWHDEPDPDHDGERPAQEYKLFLNSECLQLGLGHDDLHAWRPPDKKKARRRGKKTGGWG